MAKANDDQLSVRYERFIQGILDGKTQADAYIQAGYSPRGARSSASKLLTNPNIQGEIQKRLDEVKRQAKIHMEQRSLKAATTMTELLDSGSKDDFCRLYAAKDILDRTGLKPDDKVEHTGEIRIVKEIVTSTIDDKLPSEQESRQLPEHDPEAE